jgi:exoribonuclease-2
VGGTAPPYRRGDAELFAIVSAFDAAYATYAEFQESMERYWSLRWLQQNDVQRIHAQVARGDIVRVQGLPLMLRLAAAAAHARGQELELEIAGIDLVDLTVDARLLRVLPQLGDALAAGGEGEGDDPEPTPAPAGPAAPLPASGAAPTGA